MERNVHITEHPMVQHKLTLLRDEMTGAKEFRELVTEITMFLGYEATKDVALKEVEVKTPVAVARSKVIKGAKLALVPILRAGLQMVDGMLSLVPNARVGHLGIYHAPDEEKPVQYYCKLPGDIGERDVIVLDPMLATGQSACAAVEKLKSYNPRSIKVVSILASRQAVDAFTAAHPEVPLYLAAMDNALRDGLIDPGAGDAGNRLYGTK